MLADRKARRLYAIVIERREREVEPIDRRVTYHVIKAREVIGIWHKSRQRTARHANGSCRDSGQIATTEVATCARAS